MISKENALEAFREFKNASLANCIWENGLRIRRGNYEYVFNADEVKYIGDGSEFLIVNYDGVLDFDGSNHLTCEDVELGGRDFQIIGRAFESAEDMTVRRKIFELYTSSNLNFSLYSSGAGKNLDLLVLNGGTYDNYNFPAILEREFNFALLWRQETSTLKLKVDGEEIYSLSVPGFTERKIFGNVLVGGSILHTNATWKGTISDFKIFDGYCED